MDTTTEAAPLCAVCSKPILDDDPHTHHEADCPTVTATAAALEQPGSADCDCDPGALAHPKCCHVCAAVDAFVAAEVAG